MPSTPNKMVMGIYFYPRGGSAHVCRAVARQLGRNGSEVTVLSGSRSDLDEHTHAPSFYAGLDLRAVDFAPALGGADPLGFDGPAGTAPVQGSYEDRHEAEDPVLASIGDEDFELQVDAWSRELDLAGAATANLLYLHHLTPLNEAAARVFPAIPVLGHVHGTELLMLERIDAGAPFGWDHADAWAERIRAWAAACQRIVVSDPKGLERASEVLEVDPDRFLCAPNGFDSNFSPGAIDRGAHWRRHLVERPRGWRPGSSPGSVRYEEADLEAFEGTVLLYVGRFTAVKRLSLLIEAYAQARRRFQEPTALVLLGGHAGEWEGEHPIETIERIDCPDVFLAGWHSHADLPGFLRAADLLVHASVHEQFGQVLVEGMACGLPAIAVDRGGPALIVDDPETGWLVPPDDARAFATAMVEAVNDAPARRARGQRAREEVADRYAWGQIGLDLGAIVEACAMPTAASGV